MRIGGKVVEIYTKELLRFHMQGGAKQQLRMELQDQREQTERKGERQKKLNAVTWLELSAFHSQV